MLRRKSPRAGPPEKMLLGILAFLLLFYAARSRLPHQYEGGRASYRRDLNGARASVYSERGCTEGESGNCSNYSHTTFLWPNGIIPYIITIDSNFTEPEEEKAKVREAMDWWENATCVQFIPTNSTSEPHLIVKLKYNTERCDALTGYRRSHTIASITLTCINGYNSVGNIAHEMGHVIGLNHEHNRADRDSFITVYHDNILSDYERSYMKDENYDYFGTPYDLDSIMHYPPVSGDAINPSLPVFTLNDGIVFNGTIGQRKCLSYFDIVATNRLYRCNRTTPPKTSCNFHKMFNRSEACAALQPLNTTTETNSNNSNFACSKNSNFVYPGDTVAFKSTLRPPNRWIGCTDERMCFAWNCPGRAFALKNRSRCWEYQFVFSPVRVVSTAMTPLKFGDRVVLQRCRNYTSSTANCTSFIPLGCPGDGEQCSLVDEESCRSDSWRHTGAGSRCQNMSIFRLASPDGETHILEHGHRVMLVGDSSTAAAHQSLRCYVSYPRKRKRTCQLQPYNAERQHQHHFKIFKL